MSRPDSRHNSLQRIGRGDHRRPGVEGEAVALPEIGAPAGLVARLDDRGVDARRLQPDREREPAKPCADHCRSLHLRPPLSRCIARPIGTGGLPVSIRDLVGQVDSPCIEAADQPRVQPIEAFEDRDSARAGSAALNSIAASIR